jgi:hypothetical protein
MFCLWWHHLTSSLDELNAMTSVVMRRITSTLSRVMSNWPRGLLPNFRRNCAAMIMTELPYWHCLPTHPTILLSQDLFRSTAGNRADLSPLQYYSISGSDSDSGSSGCESDYETEVMPTDTHCTNPVCGCVLQQAIRESLSLTNGKPSNSICRVWSPVHMSIKRLLMHLSSTLPTMRWSMTVIWM